jgi:hypothetical protein
MRWGSGEARRGSGETGARQWRGEATAMRGKAMQWRGDAVARRGSGEARQWLGFQKWGVKGFPTAGCCRIGGNIENESGRRGSAARSRLLLSRSRLPLFAPDPLQSPALIKFDGILCYFELKKMLKFGAPLMVAAAGWEGERERVCN